jgi:single-stranded-DNA-specific exonuclease
VHPLLVQLLWDREVRGVEDVTAFLDPTALTLHSPWLMKGMTETVDRLVLALGRDELVAVYGDYDADGVTSTALLVECLVLLGFRAIPHIPRRTDGYGLRSHALRQLHDAGATLVLAIDCGISAAREVDEAADLGVDVIIADHHHVPELLPRAIAIINPHQDDCTYPFKDLCAVGIAYKIATALFERTGRDIAELEGWLDLVAVGTVADVVSLRDENRTLVARGLKRLNPAARIGLSALIQRAGLADGEITARSVGYALAPRLNATGRLEDATVSLDLLLTDDVGVARTLANDLEQANLQRQQLTSAAVELARVELDRREERDGKLPNVLLVASPEFPSGVVGLVAGRLVEMFSRPAVVAEIRDGKVRGSARSIEGFHLANAFDKCGAWLERQGGHAMAAGFTTGIEDWPHFQAELERVAARELTDDDLEPRLKADAILHPRVLPSDVLSLLDCLEPCGQDNRRPLFRSNGLRIVDRRVVGRTAPGHLKLKLEDEKTSWDAIGFGMGARVAEAGATVDIVYSIERNNWDGREAIQFRLVDFRPSIRQS